MPYFMDQDMDKGRVKRNRLSDPLKKDEIKRGKATAENISSSKFKVKGKQLHLIDEQNPVSHESDEESVNESPTDEAAEVDPDEPEMLHQCISCTEEHPLSDTIQTQCAHTYCRECVLRLFQNSLTNELMFPPRCCRTPIGVTIAVEDMIGLEITKRYKERKAEVSENDRTYCSNSTCSRYLPPQSIRRGVGVCDSCMVRTCVECKKQGHRGDCAIQRIKDESDEHLLERLAAKKKWQRCSKCSRIVERVTGCSHMVYAGLCPLRNFSVCRADLSLDVYVE
ncbi:hypothetical protein N7457_008244 [Penicillium paradoxum]|uniref:uncharacterized protein n=1 Tax=Penicillium paradoxum TaxID=176176 RepID=UPI002548BB37|nr:uncharacterized protein N7457_008244 [Penicillium paradoxum]KAJ5773348.1 hypothetical protein N7457_008244 [Penicillium paradoxum]